MSIFSAGVQYNDFKGTVAADRADNVSIRDYLVELGVAKHDEWVVGYRLGFGGNDGREVEEHGIVFYLQEGSFDDPGAVIRAVDVTMTAAKFFSFFKRFDLVMTVGGNTFEGIEVDGPHYD